MQHTHTYIADLVRCHIFFVQQSASQQSCSEK